MGTHRSHLAVAALLGWLVALPAGGALAAGVAVEGDAIVVTGGPESSRMGLEGPFASADSPVTYRVSDLAAPVTAGPGCRQRGEDSVECSLPGDAPAARIRADMGPGDDGIGQAAAADTPVELLGGEGNDQLMGGAGADRLDGGPGFDELIGDESFDQGAGRRRPDELIGGEGVDRANYEKHGGPSLTVTLDGRADDGRAGRGGQCPRRRRERPRRRRPR